MEGFQFIHHIRPESSGYAIILISIIYVPYIPPPPSPRMSWRERLSMTHAVQLLWRIAELRMVMGCANWRRWNIPTITRQKISPQRHQRYFTSLTNRKKNPSCLPWTHCWLILYVEDFSSPSTIKKGACTRTRPRTSILYFNKKQNGAWSSHLRTIVNGIFDSKKVEEKWIFMCLHKMFLLRSWHPTRPMASTTWDWRNISRDREYKGRAYCNIATVRTWGKVCSSLCRCFNLLPPPLPV